MSRWAAVLVGLACLGAAWVGCGGSGGEGVPRKQAAPSVPRLARVAVMVMENHEYQQVVGSPKAPWITAQAHRHGLATDYHGVAHPSLPNYLALLGGSTFGITEDCTGCHVDRKNLVDQLESAGLDWRGYIESMPSSCYRPTSGLAETGGYAKRHNPFFYFDDIRSDAERCDQVAPLSQLHSDALAPSGLPAFVWITPNLCHDTHDCSVRTGDRWLRRHVPRLLDQLGPDSALLLTWDEGTSNAGCCARSEGGRVPLLALGSAARRHSRERRPLDHYAVLRTVEEALGLPALRQASQSRGLGALLR